MILTIDVGRWHLSLVFSVNTPKSAPNAFRLQMSILAARELAPIQRKTKLDHLRRKVAAVGQITSSNVTFIREMVGEFGADFVAIAKVEQRPFGFLPIGLVYFRRINASQSNICLSDSDCVPIHYIALAAYRLDQSNAGNNCIWSSA